MNTMPIPRRPIGPASLLVLVVLAVAACTGSAASPAPSVAVGPPGASPSHSASSAPSASSDASAGPVTSAAAAFAIVQARSPWFDGVKPKDPNTIGQAAWWEATPSTQAATSTDGAWGVTVDVGWGDCQAGCIDHHVWQWQVAKDGSVTLMSETGPALPADQRAARAATSTGSGIGGEVTAGPTCPAERVGDSACAHRPVKGALLVVQDASGKEVARFTTDASGLFRIDLPAGTYTLASQPVTGIMGTAAPQQVTVAAGKVTMVALGYDTGIR
jgi:Carboxypeptidase regulatory-like domain